MRKKQAETQPDVCRKREVKSVKFCSCARYGTNRDDNDDDDKRRRLTDCPSKLIHTTTTAANTARRRRRMSTRRRRRSWVLRIERLCRNARRHQLGSLRHAGTGGTERCNARRRRSNTHRREPTLRGRSHRRGRIMHSAVRVDGRRRSRQSRHWRRRQTGSRRRHRRKTQISHPITNVQEH